MDLSSIGDTLPSIVSTTIAMIFLSGLTLFVANRAGIGDISVRADAVSDRLVERQADEIQLLEKRVKYLEDELSLALEREKRANERIEALERLVSDEQIRKLRNR